MRSLRIAAPVALGLATLVGVAAVTTAASDNSPASPAKEAPSHDVPVAEASGTDVVTPVYPGTVNERVTRAEASLERATAAVDGGQEAAAIPEILSARDNMVKAWTSAKYIISQPPPVPPDPEAEPAEPVPGAYAEPADTAAQVLNLQHEVVSTSLGLLDTAGPELGAALRGTISGTMTQRDDAINYINTIAPPVVGEDAVSPAPVGGTFDVVMPLFAPQVGDEILQANTTLMSASSPANFGGWVAQRATATQNQINTLWPAVVDD